MSVQVVRVSPRVYLCLRDPYYKKRNAHAKARAMQATCGSSSVAERQLPKLNVAGSIPVSRSILPAPGARNTSATSRHKHNGRALSAAFVFHPIALLRARRRTRGLHLLPRR